MEREHTCNDINYKIFSVLFLSPFPPHYPKGPEEDQEPESALSVSELKEQAAKLKREAEVLKQAEINEEEERERQRQKILDTRGCSWGMGMSQSVKGCVYFQTIINSPAFYLTNEK